MAELMDLVTVSGNWLMEVDMFPVFFIAHFVIACIIVREDSKDLGARFRQDHPFALWLCTVICGLSGVFVENFLFGEPLIAVFKENELIAFLTIIWYLMNYSPFDVVYKVVMFPPVILALSVAQEILRVRFLYLGLIGAAKSQPGAYLVILAAGAIKGNGYGFLKVAERLIRGKWRPKENDLLEVTYFAKSGFYASVVFLLHHLGKIKASIELVYLCVVVVFIFFRLTIMIGKVGDPLLPIEMPFCRLVFGSKVADSEDAVDKMDAVEPVNKKASKKDTTTVKSKAQKKKD